MKNTYWQTIDKVIGPASVSEFDQIGQKETRGSFERFIIEHSNPFTKILDAGCNTGIEAWRLYQNNFQGIYTGVDSNAKALKYAIENLHGFPAAFSLADLESIKYPNGYFDIVLNKDVIEHAIFYEAILAELARLTGKTLVLSMFIRMHDKPDIIHREPQGFYHNRYDRHKLYRFMSDHGFGMPEIIFQSGEDEVLVFEKL